MGGGHDEYYKKPHDDPLSSLVSVHGTCRYGPTEGEDMNSTRRVFLKAVGTAIANLMLSPYVYAQADSRRDHRPNVILILADDHRFDAMGFAGHPFLQTPHMDRMARDGVYLANAFVTTSLCSPSRASILTGLYAHNHAVIDNYNPVPTSLRFFPEYLQK